MKEAPPPNLIPHCPWCGGLVDLSKAFAHPLDGAALDRATVALSYAADRAAGRSYTEDTDRARSGALARPWNPTLSEALDRGAAYRREAAARQERATFQCRWCRAPDGEHVPECLEGES